MTEFTVSDKIATASRQKIDRELHFHNLDNNAPVLDCCDLSVIKHGGQGEVEAGIYGYTFWNWLRLDALWVHPSLRKQGIGRSLMKAAEEEACRRGCTGCYFFTMSFQAPWLYPKLGYKEFVSMPDFPKGHQRIGFMKLFT